MSEVIRVRDNNSVEAFTEALQLALHIVVTPANIQRILTDRYDTHKYQYVHPNGEGSALGSVTMLTTDTYKKRHDFGIIVTLHHGRKDPRLAIVPELASRAMVRFVVGGAVLWGEFTLDQANHQYNTTIDVPAKFSRVVSVPEIRLVR